MWAVPPPDWWTSVAAETHHSAIATNRRRATGRSWKDRFAAYPSWSRRCPARSGRQWNCEPVAATILVPCPETWPERFHLCECSHRLRRQSASSCHCAPLCSGLLYTPVSGPPPADVCGRILELIDSRFDSIRTFAQFTNDWKGRDREMLSKYNPPTRRNYSNEVRKLSN